MEPIFPTNMIQSNPSFAMTGSYIFAPGVFMSEDERKDFLSSLDSDTRDYVIKHTDEFRTKQDIADCIERLHGNRQ